MKKTLLILSAFSVIALSSCGDRENTGNGADDKPVKGPYQYTNDKNQIGNSDSSANSNDSLNMR